MKNLRGTSKTPSRMALINDWTIHDEEHSGINNDCLVNLDILVNGAFDRVDDEGAKLLRKRVETGHVRIVCQNLAYC